MMRNYINISSGETNEIDVEETKEFHFENVKSKITNGYDVISDVDNEFLGACSCGNFKIVKFMHEQGHDILSSWRNPFILACSGGDLKTVKYLHENGFDLNKIEEKNAFISCCESGSVDVARYLISLGCDINEKTSCGKTGLMTASYANQFEMVKMFMEEKKCNIHDCDNSGKNAISWALSRKRCAIAIFLMEHGVKYVDQGVRINNKTRKKFHISKQRRLNEIKELENTLHSIKHLKKCIIDLICKFTFNREVLYKFNLPR